MEGKMKPQKFDSMGGLTFDEIAKLAGHMELVVITPEMATHWLGSMYVRQRKKNVRFAGSYQRSMEEGHWKTSNDAIVISKSGELLNGQHRLMAVVDNGQPIVAWVLQNASDDMYDIIDNVNARSASQVLNCSNSNDIGAMSKLFVTIDDGVSFATAMRSTTNIPRWMVTEYADENMERLQLLVKVSKSVRKQFGTGAGTAYGLAIHVFDVLYDDFYIQDVTQMTMDADITTLNLQRAVMRNSASTGRLTKEWVLGSMLKFLEAKRESKDVSVYSRQSQYVKKYEELYRQKRIS